MVPPMSGLPLVTVLVPTFNRPALLRQAVLSACRQSHRELEILVLDDHSTDETAEVARSLAEADPRVRHIRHPKNLGIVGNWRAGFGFAKGRYLGILHDDDLWDPGFVATLMRPLEADPGLVLGFCDHKVIAADGSDDAAMTEEAARRFGRDRLPEGKLADFARMALVDLAVPVGACLFRRDRLREDMLEDGARGAIDAWLVYSCVKTGLGAWFEPRRLMSYRTGVGGMSGSAPVAMCEGHFYRYSRILADPAMTEIHPAIRWRQADTCYGYGVAMVLRGQNTTGRAQLLNAWRSSRSPRSLVVLALSYGGPLGRRLLRALRRP